MAEICWQEYYEGKEDWLVQREVKGLGTAFQSQRELPTFQFSRIVADFQSQLRRTVVFGRKVDRGVLYLHLVNSQRYPRDTAEVARKILVSELEQTLAATTDWSHGLGTYSSTDFPPRPADPIVVRITENVLQRLSS